MNGELRLQAAIRNIKFEMTTKYVKLQQCSLEQDATGLTEHVT
jgi:hypothetical protein